MSQAENVAATSSEQKRVRRKGVPMSDYERHQAAVARKRETHKPIKVYVKNPLKDLMMTLCKNEGITQAQLIERLLEAEIKRNCK